jgi:hypothetical protein
MITGLNVHRITGITVHKISDMLTKSLAQQDLVIGPNISQNRFIIRQLMFAFAYG